MTDFGDYGGEIGRNTLPLRTAPPGQIPDREVTIDSTFRQFGIDQAGGPALFAVQNPSRLNKFSRIQLVYANISNSFPNARGTFQVEYPVAGPLYTINVDGHTPDAGGSVYRPDAATLATDLQAALIATIGAGWTVAFDSSRLQYTITGPADFILHFGSGQADDQTGPGWLRIARALGFSEQQTYASASSVVQSSKSADLRGPLSVFVKLNDNGHNSVARFASGSTPYTWSIPLDSFGYYTSTYREGRDYHQYVISDFEGSQDSYSNFRVQVIYPNGRLAEFHGVNWTLIFHVY